MTMPDGSGAPPGGYPASVPPPQQPGYPPSVGYPPPGPPVGYPPAGPPSYAPPAAPPRRNRRSGLVALGVLVLLVVLIVGGLYLFRDRISGDVFSLQVGDCIDEPSDTSSITDVQHQPCTDPHDGEVFANLTYPSTSGTAYPGSTGFEDFVQQQCLPALPTYTGRTFDEIDSAGLSYAWFYPTNDSWTNSNDRGVTCYIAKSDGTKLTGSVRASSGASSHSP